MAKVEFGTYFFSDTGLDLAGGAVLYSDCTHDGSLIGAIPIGPNRSVLRFIPTTWVNDPDPTLLPYSKWAVPAALLDVPRLFLCYRVERIAGIDIHMNEFCDWLPRDLKGPIDIDIDGNGLRDMLATVDYHDNSNGAGRQCADQ